jgi:hypothetical protein
MYANLCSEKFLKKLVGKKNIEDALRRLDKLTQEEARMAAAQILSLTHAVDDKVTGVGSKLKGVDNKMDIVIKGTPVLLVTHLPILIAYMYLDGKDTKVFVQQTSNNVDDMKCS